MESNATVYKDYIKLMENVHHVVFTSNTMAKNANVCMVSMLMVMEDVPAAILHAEDVSVLNQINVYNAQMFLILLIKDHVKERTHAQQVFLNQVLYAHHVQHIVNHVNLNITVINVFKDLLIQQQYMKDLRHRIVSKNVEMVKDLNYNVMMVTYKMAMDVTDSVNKSKDGLV